MILVTGAAGFIGSHVVDRLLADGHRVLGIDNFDPLYDRTIKETNLAPALRNPRFTFVPADVCDASALETAFSARSEPIEAVIHLAALVGVRESIRHPVRYHEVNLMGTLRLLEAAKTLGIRQFVLASSSSVYGVNPRVPWREDDRDLMPISPYAGSKLAAEMAGRIFSHLHGIRVVALRFFTVYGPRQRPDLAIAKFAHRMSRGEAIPVFGDGSTRRDYTYVDDIVEGIVRALGFSHSTFEVINLGNHHTVSLTEMIAVLGATLGVTPKIETLPAQPGDAPQTWADVAKAERLLDWRPKTTFESGIQAYAAWLESGPPGEV